MELALSLGGDAAMTKPFSSVDQSQRPADLGFCMGLGTGRSNHDRRAGSPDRPVQLDLLPFSPVPRAHRPSPELLFPWLVDKKLMGSPERSEVPAAEEAAPSSPNTSATASSLRADFPARDRGNNKRDLSDDEDNALTRKKLRLSKDQSAFLEESFKEHSTLNPKEKLALAKQLNLRPRQVEVWFQNRRARTKLKQTEVDCEYLKKCCETLTEENRRLQKELQELRALKSSSRPFFMQLPATTLTMCPSCERVAAAGPPAAKQPRPAFPFSHAQAQPQAQAH